MNQSIGSVSSTSLMIKIGSGYQNESWELDMDLVITPKPDSRNAPDN